MLDAIVPIVLSLGLVVLVLALLFFITRIVMKKTSGGAFASHHQKMFLVLLPRERNKGEEKQEQNAERFKSQLAQAERMIAAIGGLRVPRGFMSTLTGKEADQVSFEIVAHKGMISFYVVVPDNMVNYILQQIRASYDEVEFEEVEDYNIFGPTSKVSGVFLKQKKPFYLPIKTFTQFESDPLESLTNVLNKLSPDESAAIQFITRSAPGSWHMSAKQAVARITRGEKLLEDKKDPAAKALSMAGKVFKETVLGAKPQDKDEEKPVRLSPKEEETAKMIEDKNSKAGLEINVRILVTGSLQESVKSHMMNIANSFAQYNIYEYGNELSAGSEQKDRFLKEFIFRRFHPQRKLILNTEEFISLFHFPLATTQAPNIRWLASRKAPAPVHLPEEGIAVGYNIYRENKRLIRVTDDDRRRHMHIIGTTGTGKSYFMYSMAMQDIERGKGIGIVDPHGDFVDYVLENIPKERYEDVVVFEPSNFDRPVGLNMLEATDPQQKDFVIQEMIQIFYKLVPNPEMIGPMFEHNMRNAMLTLMADEKNPGTIAEIPRIFTDTEYQQELVKKLTDPVVRAFWEKEMAKTSDFHKSEMLGYLISKVGRFVENEMMRNIIGQAKSGIDFKDIIRNKKILLVNLSKGLVGEINSNLLGLIVVSKLQMAAFDQAKISQDQRQDFYLYIDEFQNYTTDSIATILSEARKYRLNLTMAHQYLGQLVHGSDSSIRDAVLGNVGTMVSFRIGVEDAPTIAQQMAPVFGEYDLVNLEARNAYIKPLMNGTVQRAFSLFTLDAQKGDPQKAQLLRELSSRKYGRDKAIVEREILERSKLGEVAKQADVGSIEASL